MDEFEKRVRLEDQLNLSLLSDENIIRSKIKSRKLKRASVTKTCKEVLSNVDGAGEQILKFYRDTL